MDRIESENLTRLRLNLYPVQAVQVGRYRSPNMSRYGGRSRRTGIPLLNPKPRPDGGSPPAFPRAQQKEIPNDERTARAEARRSRLEAVP